MPWFVKKQNDKYCVVKGTKEQPGETVKCHGSKDDANAHLRALYVNNPQYTKREVPES